MENHQTLSLDLFQNVHFLTKSLIDPFEKDQFFGHSQICTFFSSKVLCVLFRISPNTLSTPNMPKKNSLIFFLNF